MKRFFLSFGPAIGTLALTLLSFAPFDFEATLPVAMAVVSQDQLLPEVQVEKNQVPTVPMPASASEPQEVTSEKTLIKWKKKQKLQTKS